MSGLHEDENPIIYYNDEISNLFLVISTTFQREIFLKFGLNIICIDSTHDTNEYGLHLTTIVEIDEFGNGVPCCFGFSTKKDTDLWFLLFSKVKEKVGVIKCTTFMSNAWEHVMRLCPHRLLFAWHVDQAWRRQIQTMIRGFIREESSSL